MELIYTLLPLFILWEVLGALGIHDKFIQDLKGLDAKNSPPNVALLFGVSGICFLFVSFGYSIWAFCGMILTDQFALFLLLIFVGVPKLIARNKPVKTQSIINKLDSIVSIIILFTILFS